MGSNKVRGFDENRLISLINMTNRAQLGLTKMIRKNFELISQAREAGASWTSIVEALGEGWSGEEKLIRTAYAKERRKQQSRGIVPAKNEKLKIKNEQSAPNRQKTVKKIGDPFSIEPEPEPLVKRKNFNFKECQINEGD